MLNATVTITGLDKALAQLNDLKGIINALDEPLKQAGEYLLEFFMEDVFSSQGGDIGEAWAALSEKYALEKERKYGAGLPILVATGRMRTSYKLYTASDYFLIRNEAQTERGDYYASYHQTGTDKMPRRMMMKFQPEQLNQVRDIIVNYLNNQIKSL